MKLPGVVRDDQRTAGFALFAVLSFSLLAATVATPFLTGSRTRALIARNVAAELRHDMTARGLLHIAATRLMQLRKTPDFILPTAVNCQIGPVQISFAFQGQGGLIDLNHAPKELLGIGFGALGFDETVSDRLADAVIDFRAAKTDPAFSATDNVRGGNKHAVFEAVSELGDFDGISGRTLSQLQALFTVHNGTGTIYSDQASANLQLAIRSLQDNQAYFVVQGQAAPAAVSIDIEVSRAVPPALHLAAIIGGTDTHPGYAFLSPIKVEPVPAAAPIDGNAGGCARFFGGDLLVAMNSMVVDQ